MNEGFRKCLTFITLSKATVGGDIVSVCTHNIRRSIPAIFIVREGTALRCDLTNENVAARNICD